MKWTYLFWIPGAFLLKSAVNRAKEHLIRGDHAGFAVALILPVTFFAVAALLGFWESNHAGTNRRKPWESFAPLVVVLLLSVYLLASVKAIYPGLVSTWGTISPRMSGFTISLPLYFLAKSDSGGVGLSYREEGLYNFQSPAEKYELSYNGYAPELIRGTAAERLKSLAQSVESKVGVTVLDEQDVLIDSHYPGKEIRYRDQSVRPSVVARVFVIENRFYIMSYSAVAGKENTYDRTNFFASFHCQG